MKDSVPRRKSVLPLEELACFECPLSELDPPKDCNWSNPGKGWSPYCPFQREYAERHRKEEKNG